MLLFFGGCGPVIVPEAEAGTGSASSETGSPTTTTTTTTTTSTGTTRAAPLTDDGADETSTGLGFIEEPDGGLSRDCDLIQQDWCAEGYKCVPWANDGGTDWNAARCVPLVEEPALIGEPCQMRGSDTSGFDDCEFGSMCWDVDPVTLMGTCVAQCLGSVLGLECPPTTSCLFANDGALNLCLPDCDPLASDCPPDHSCAPAEQGRFVCLRVRDEVGAGEGCDYTYNCGAGMACVRDDFVGPGCTSYECCTPYCDLSQPDPAATCIDPTHSCVPWWERTDQEALGHCGVPK